jgi:hypothetical protein
MTKERQIAQKFIYQDFTDLLPPIAEEPLQLPEEVLPQQEESNEYVELFSHVDEAGYVNKTEEALVPDPIDIEQVKLEKYEEGYKKAKEELEPLLARKEAEDNFLEKLNAKLDSLNITEEVTGNIAEEIIEIIQAILKPLNKALPTNFEKVFGEHFIPIIQKGISIGNIEIRSHSSKKEIIAKIIAERVKDNISRIKLIEDDNLNTDDIKVDYGNGQFQYKNDEILAAIDKIISTNLNPE